MTNDCPRLIQDIFHGRLAGNEVRTADQSITRHGNSDQSRSSRLPHGPAQSARERLAFLIAFLIGSGGHAPQHRPHARQGPPQCSRVIRRTGDHLRLWVRFLRQARGIISDHSEGELRRLLLRHDPVTNIAVWCDDKYVHIYPALFNQGISPVRSGYANRCCCLPYP